MLRRHLLLNLFGSPAGISGVGSAVSILSSPDVGQAKSVDCSRPLHGPYAYHIPNVVVRSHEDQNALFYSDLLRGKTVMINCLSTRNEAAVSITRNLARVQTLLGDRLGRDLFMYSITVDPEYDTPRVLKAFAEKHQAGPGWIFLTGERAGIDLLRSKLFISDGGHGHDHGRPVEDCSQALMRYGNEAVGLWGSVPAKSKPQSIAMRLSWIESKNAATVALRRGGPLPLVAEHFSRGRQ